MSVEWCTAQCILLVISMSIWVSLEGVKLEPNSETLTLQFLVDDYFDPLLTVKCLSLSWFFIFCILGLGIDCCKPLKRELVNFFFFY